MTKRHIAEPQDSNARHIALHDERGDFVTGDDGYVVFWPDGVHVGAFNSHDLRVIAAELDRRNAAWDAQIQSDPRIAARSAEPQDSDAAWLRENKPALKTTAGEGEVG